jgi:hypothetical protein
MRLGTSVDGTKRTSSDVRVESAIGREADNLSKAGRAQEKVNMPNLDYGRRPDPCKDRHFLPHLAHADARENPSAVAFGRS